MKWYLALCASFVISTCQAEQVPASNVAETPAIQVAQEEASGSWWDKAKGLWSSSDSEEQNAEPEPPAEEVAQPENAEEDSKSWWGKAKDSTADMWNKASSYVSSDSEEENQPITPDEEPTQQADRNPYFGKIWDEITPRISEILSLEQKQESLPDKAWFVETKESNQSKLNELLDEAVEILSLSESNQIRQQIRDIEQEIVELKNTIADYRQAQVSAPVESTWKTTVEDYNDKIVNVQDQIAQKYQQIDDLKSEFGQHLQQLGVRLTDDQLDVLFASVVGDDIIQASLVYENVKLVNEQLMKLTVDSEEEFTISKRYYGMYVVLLKILYHMQDGFVADIDNKYVPKISDIVNNVQTIKNKTQSLLNKKDSNNHREHLLANLEAQKLTLKTANLYKQHLTNQRQKMLAARDKTLADLLVAENTFATVTVSSELVNLLRTSQKAFELLQNMQTPDLLIFENLQMKQEFAVLTEKLNS
ncbi:hypothetical protein [Candidatus Albibeggiatoa sp. nov. NOAA]|uniref:hypothetical protein n=1 Tax=Candidatus Albibeggiatoa sp. nov. NOAA TaxID=3162724 RepID=UPI0032FACD5A|nr:hypothetical protein [Thiotrichaceae bacterium]